MDVSELLIASGDSLDGIATIQPVVRAAYGCIRSSKPNDHCYWDSDFGLWMEDDASFRARILAECA